VLTIIKARTHFHITKIIKLLKEQLWFVIVIIWQDVRNNELLVG